MIQFRTTKPRSHLAEIPSLISERQNRLTHEQGKGTENVGPVGGKVFDQARKLSGSMVATCYSSYSLRTSCHSRAQLAKAGGKSGR